MKQLVTWQKKLAFTILFAALLLGVLFGVDLYINYNLENQLVTSLEDIANQNVLLIQNQIEHRFNLLTNLAKEFYGDEPIDYENSHIRTNELAERFGFRELGLAVPDGTAYSSFGTTVNISHRTYFQKSMQGENYVSEPLIDITDQSNINAYSVPVYNSEGQVKAVFFAIYDTSEFQQRLQISSFHGNGYSYIINSQGDVIADSPNISSSGKYNIDTMIDTDPTNASAVATILNNIQNNQPGCVTYNFPSNRYAWVTSLGVNDWWLVTVVPTFVLRQRILPISNTIHILCFGLFAISIGCSLYLIRKYEGYQKHLQTIAYIDTFTKLRNKAYLKEHLQHLFKKHSNKQCALVIYNIRKFKTINEIYGTSVGDQLIQQFALTLQQYTDSQNEIAIHDHADEFAVLYFYNTLQSLQQRIEELIERTRYLDCQNNQINITLAIGAYIIGNPNDSFEKIYHCANIATKKNKQPKSDLVTYYSEELSETEAQRKLSEDAIRKGIEQKEFKAWFQPKYDCVTKEIVGCEALARWYKPDGSILTPYHFVPLSEQTGLIGDIDEQIFEDVCIKLSQWLSQGLDCVPISVNLSRAYLGSTNYLERLQEILQTYQIPTKYIHLEITESTIVDNEYLLNQMIEQMHQLGFKVLLDDFGVGYSSLTSIRSLNFDVMKIDKSFVDGIGTSTGDFIIQYTMDLGKKLGMEIVAEGVETNEQYAFLKEHGCQVIQGYYFSKPLPCDSFAELLQPVSTSNKS